MIKWIFFSGLVNTEAPKPYSSPTSTFQSEMPKHLDETCKAGERTWFAIYLPLCNPYQ